MKESLHRMNREGGGRAFSLPSGQRELRAARVAGPADFVPTGRFCGPLRPSSPSDPESPSLPPNSKKPAPEGPCRRIRDPPPVPPGPRPRPAAPGGGVTLRPYASGISGTLPFRLKPSVLSLSARNLSSMSPTAAPGCPADAFQVPAHVGRRSCSGTGRLAAG